MEAVEKAMIVASDTAAMSSQPKPSGGPKLADTPTPKPKLAEPKKADDTTPQPQPSAPQKADVSVEKQPPPAPMAAQEADSK